MDFTCQKNIKLWSLEAQVDLDRTAVQMYKNSLILRMCMTEKPFVHKSAYANMKTNFIFHEDIIPNLKKF